MLNSRLVAQAAQRLANPTPRSAQRDRMLFASIAAESLKLEGIETSTDDVVIAAAIESEGTHVIA